MPVPVRPVPVRAVCALPVVYLVRPGYYLCALCASRRVRAVVRWWPAWFPGARCATWCAPLYLVLSLPGSSPWCAQCSAWCVRGALASFAVRSWIPGCSPWVHLPVLPGCACLVRPAPRTLLCALCAYLVPSGTALVSLWLPLDALAYAGLFPPSLMPGGSLSRCSLLLSPRFSSW